MMLDDFGCALTHADAARFSRDVASGGLLSVNLRNGDARWSVGLYALLGLPPTVEPTWDVFVQMVHPDDRMTDAQVQSLLDAATALSLTFRIKRADGSICAIASEWDVVFDTKGRATKVVVSLHRACAEDHLEPASAASETLGATATDHTAI